MLRTAIQSRLALLMVGVIAATMFGVESAPPGGFVRRSHTIHQDMGAAPVPSDFLIAQADPDPTGQRGSGGTAVAHYAGARPAGRAAARHAPDARLYRTGFGAWEPTLGITSRGSVVFDGLTDDGAPFVGASRDGGASWEVVFDGHPVTADPYLYVDPETSRIFANDYVPPCHLLSYSDDEGRTWTQAPPAGCLFNADHQTIFAGPPPEGGAQPQTYENVVYLCSIGLGISIASAGSVCSKSLDGGRTFVPTGAPAFTDDPSRSGDYGLPGVCNGANAHGFVGPDGMVYLPRGWCGQPWLAISHDEGLTWERVQVAENGMPCCSEMDELLNGLYSHEAAVVADAEGNVYYSWVAADRLPYLAISRDGGQTWGRSLMIGPPGLREALLPGMAIGSSGKIAVFYMGSANSPWDPQTQQAKGSYDQERWNAYITMTANALDQQPVFYSAPLNDPDDPMHIGPCGPDPIRCGWGDFLDVVISPAGEPWAVAVDLCDGSTCSDGGEAVVARLVGGPRLVAGSRRR